MNGTTSSAGEHELRFWERLLLAVFGGMLIGAHLHPVWDIAMRSLGWVIIGSALGVTELLMACYFRLRRWGVRRSVHPPAA